MTQVAQRLPHALLIEAEAGLDTDRVIQTLAHTEPTDIIPIEAVPPATRIGTQQVRQLIATLRTHARQRRLVVFPQALQLTEAAQHALLKTLEEPNARTHFLLAATDSTQLLATIRSRCQLLRLHRTTANQDNQLLQTYETDPAKRQQVTFLAAGRPALLRHLLEHPDELADRVAIARDAKRYLQTTDAYTALVLLQPYMTDREAAHRLLETIVIMLRYQLYQHHSSALLRHHLAAVTAAQQQLNQNGHIRLALLQLVV